MTDCSLTNLATCIPEKLFEFILKIINAPLQPLLSLIKSLLSEPINLQLFISLWAIILYVLSLFYGLLLLYSGFQFIISGYDIEKRERAKESFKNIIIMIFLIQASYFIYDLILELNSLLTTAVLSLVDQEFFLLTIDNLLNLGLEIVFVLPYLVVLLITSLILIIRYLIIALGIVFFPIAIFLYFLNLTKDYGRLILNFLFVNIFVSFFSAIIILTSSKLVSIEIFSNFKILIMIATFLLIDILMVYLMFFAAIKSSFNVYSRISGVVSRVRGN